MFEARSIRQVGSARRVLAIAVVLLAVATACADSTSALGPRPTLGSRVASPMVDEGGTLVVGGDPEAASSGEPTTEPVWSESEVVPEALAPDASAEQIRLAAEQMLGPTNDVVAQMNRLVPFPDLAVPDRVDVIEFRADSRLALDTVRTMVTAEVAFTADGTPAELVEFFEEVLGSEGATPTVRAERLQGAQVVQLLGFDLEAEPGTTEELELEIRSATDLEGSSRCRVDLRHVAVGPVAEDLQGGELFLGWISGLPLPTEGIVTGGGIQTSSLGRRSLHYNLDLSYERKDPQAVASELRAALPSGDFAADPRPPTDDATDNWVFLNTSFFDDARVSIHDGTLGGRALTLVSIDARIDLDG